MNLQPIALYLRGRVVYADYASSPAAPLALVKKDKSWEWTGLLTSMPTRDHVDRLLSGRLTRVTLLEVVSKP